ncbi:MAG: hypothetical protein NVSMB14_16220 [Isosphaeraceae bacterium]
MGDFIQAVIHLPGLRGAPERLYPVAGIGPFFPGRVDFYTAGLIDSWATDAKDLLGSLGKDLEYLGLTWKVEARRVNDAYIELHVGRLPKMKRGGSQDLVNIADVGLGVSQILPVLVALRAARPGQLVYIEQPEIHLHPRAQVAMAKLFANAAKRGARVVVETHSSLLLLGIQTLVAEGELDPSLVGLNWFSRKNGITEIQRAELDDAGRFGDWPEDFADVSLDAEHRYLTAAEQRLARTDPRG